MELYHGQGGQMSLLAPLETGKRQTRKKPPPRPAEELAAIPYLHLDLVHGPVDLFGEHTWELCSPHRAGKPPLNTGPAPRVPVHVSLSDILEPAPKEKYYLSRAACLGILRRAEERDKALPAQLLSALMVQAGLWAAPVPFREVKAYHINQRDEGIDLGDVSGALMATPSNMQMQTFVTAGFCAGAAPSAGGIGYQEEVAPTLKAAESGTNQVPSVLCLNDQGGSVMDCSEDVSATLRAQEHGHQPLVYENHGIDARYTGPHPVAPTLSARAGTGGNNLPLVEQEAPKVICIMGPAIDRQPHNGGNGIGYQENIAYTLTATDHHAVFSRQRVDKFAPGDAASTQSARQGRDATDLIYQETVGTLTSSDRRGPNAQYVAQDKLVVETPLLIRRLTPLECERLQGFPDGWTALPGASDSARYKALGNSVAIPCVEFIMAGIVKVVAGDSSC